MRLDPDTVAMLRRMDPAELVVWLPLHGPQYRPEREFATKDELLAAERGVVLGAGHKARVVAGRPTFAKHEVDDSRRWLRENGFRTLHGSRH